MASALVLLPGLGADVQGPILIPQAWSRAASASVGSRALTVHPAKLSRQSPLVWTGEQGAHFSLGAAGLGQPRGRAVVGGKGREGSLLLPCSRQPTSARSGLSWGGDAAAGLDTCIFMDQTLGKHSGQLPLGVAFLSCLAAP